MICLESVGYFDDSATQALPTGFGLVFPDLAKQVRHGDGRSDFLLAIHRASSANFVSRWQETAQQAGLRTLALRDPRWDGPGQRLTRWINPLYFDLDRSDHAPFWRNRVPSVLITGTAPFRNPHYHRATDTPDTLDYRRLERLAASLTAQFIGN